MTGRFRVTACAASNPCLRLIKEFYDERRDADEFYGQLQRDDTILGGCGYPAVIIALDELCNDDWTNINTKLVIIGGE